jgi:hypothetical protein
MITAGRDHPPPFCQTVVEAEAPATPISAGTSQEKVDTWTYWE